MDLILVDVQYAKHGPSVVGTSNITSHSCSLRHYYPFSWQAKISNPAIFLHSVCGKVFYPMNNGHSSIPQVQLQSNTLFSVSDAPLCQTWAWLLTPDQVDDIDTPKYVRLWIRTISSWIHPFFHSLQKNCVLSECNAVSRKSFCHHRDPNIDF